MYDTNNPSLDADAFLETVDKGIQCTDPAERQTYFASVYIKPNELK
jgi:hypothetical protein